MDKASDINKWKDRTESLHELTPESAMERAREAAADWRITSVKDRLSVLTRLRLLLVRDMDRWAEVLGREAYKTPMDTLASDLLTTADAIRYCEKQAPRLLRTRRVRTPILFFGSKSYVLQDPVGVVAVIAPWNFPLQLALVPAVNAWASGNAVVLKPSEKLPETARLLALTLHEAGFPPGVAQVVNGGRECVEQLIDARPDKIFFTGGAAAGRNVLKRAAEAFIPCDLELSGKDPMIVCEDANLGRAARAAVWGGFMNSGQVCVGIERVYVQEKVYAPFLEAVVRETKKLIQSPDSWSDIGGMTTPEGWEQCRTQLADAISKGACVEAGGLEPHAEPPLFPPTVLTNVTSDMRVMQEETFGPLLPILPYRTDQEAIRLANDSPFGLNASVFTRNVSRGLDIARQLETGNCAINDAVRNIGNMRLPFGGVKESGYGRTHGSEGLLSFTHSKSVMTNKGRRDKEINWFPYREQTYLKLQQAMRFLYGRGGHH